MRKKRRMAIICMACALTVCASGTVAFASEKAAVKNDIKTNAVNCVEYTDINAEGICDYRGTGRNFSDNDKDGICDQYKKSCRYVGEEKNRNCGNYGLRRTCGQNRQRRCGSGRWR